MLISALIEKLARIIVEEGDIPVVVVAPGWEGDTTEEEPDVKVEDADGWHERRAVISE